MERLLIVSAEIHFFLLQEKKFLCQEKNSCGKKKFVLLLHRENPSLARKHFCECMVCSIRTPFVIKRLLNKPHKEERNLPWLIKNAFKDILYPIMIRVRAFEPCSTKMTKGWTMRVGPPFSHGWTSSKTPSLQFYRGDIKHSFFLWPANRRRSVSTVSSRGCVRGMTLLTPRELRSYLQLLLLTHQLPPLPFLRALNFVMPNGQTKSAGLSGFERL